MNYVCSIADNDETVGKTLKGVCLKIKAGNFEILSRDGERKRVFFSSSAIENLNRPREGRARQFLRLIYTRYRAAVYSVFRSTACRYKRRKLPFAASLVHGGPRPFHYA